MDPPNPVQSSIEDGMCKNLTTELCQERMLRNFPRVLLRMEGFLPSSLHNYQHRSLAILMDLNPFSMAISFKDAATKPVSLPASSGRFLTDLPAHRHTHVGNFPDELHSKPKTGQDGGREIQRSCAELCASR